MSLPLNQIVHGDCVEVLQGFPENSIDLVVTDPPYGLGFMGKDWDQALPSKESFKELYRVLKPGAIAFVMSSPRQDLIWRMCALLEESGFQLSQSFISWIYKTGFPKAYDLEKNGAGEEWTGWKAQTGLKPALEPILMVIKPHSEPTIIDNVNKWGTGAINIDACRIPVNGERISARGTGNQEEKAAVLERTNSMGRFPANLIVSDDALNDGELTKSGSYASHHVFSKDENGDVPNNVYGKYKRLSADQYTSYGDEGSKSRFFDLDAWAVHHGFLDVPKPNTQERDFGLTGKKGNPKSKFNKSNGRNERFDGSIPIPRRNVHPTVKPIKLMAYLIELGCPKNGVVLDPFVGSGTTCIAAKQLCRKYIGIELEAEYHILAQSRVAAYPEPLEWFIQ